MSKKKKGAKQKKSKASKSIDELFEQSLTSDSSLFEGTDEAYRVFDEAGKEETKTEVLFRYWDSFCSSPNIERICDSMTFDYEKNRIPEKRTEIAEALKLWRYAKREFDSCRYYQDDECISARLEFLSAFVWSENKLVALVAMIEMMPINVWRKLLWQHNIDFSSLESFLRRINEVQYEALKIAFLALSKDDFSASQDGRRNRRYLSKGSMSYNLLNLDFGFNAYPNGVNDDKQVVEVSPWRFLSIKNHADDFVVNTESGRYFSLYKSARSNFVWFPKEEVRLKTHICPGFWVTLLLHLWFWLGSPLLFTSIVGAHFAGLFKDVSAWIVLPSLAPALLTPIWCICALIKLLFIKIENCNFSFGLPSVELTQEQKVARKKRKERLILISGYCFFLFISYGMFCGIKRSVGLFEAVLTSGMFFLFVCHNIINFDKRSGPPFHERMSKCVSVPLIAGGQLLLVLLSMKYAGYLVVALQFIAELLWAIFSGTAAYIIAVFTKWLPIVIMTWLPALIKTAFVALCAIGLAWLAALIPMGMFLIVFFWVPSLSKEVQIKIDYCIEKATMVFMAAFIVGLGYAAWRTYLISTLDTQTFWVFACMALFMILMLGATMLLAREKNPEIIEAKSDLDSMKWILNCHQNYDYRLLTRNEWLRRLSSDERKELVSRTSSFAKSISYKSSDEQALVELIMRYANDEVLSRLEACEKEICTMPLRIRHKAVKLMLEQGYNFELAVAKASGWFAKLDQFAESVHAFLKACATPVVIVWKGVVFCCNKMVEVVMTLKYLRNLFSKRCPYVMPSKYLD